MTGDLKSLFEEFSARYDWEGRESVWQSHSTEFRKFWEERVLNDDIEEINDTEIDTIVRLLDKHGKGNTKDSQSVARVMIPQGVWRRMFNDIHSTEAVRTALSDALRSLSATERANAIDRLYVANEGRKNSLTGRSANAINAMLAAYAPFECLSIVSLNHRTSIVQGLGFTSVDFGASPGEKVTKSSQAIIEGFRNLGITANARALSEFVYSDSVMALWKRSDEPERRELPSVVATSPGEMLFYMESQLEDFLIENWDNTELGQQLDLIKDDSDELVSQQFLTDIGRIDILARERDTGRYVVIELKKNQTSDDTIGQLARYMGWIDEHLSEGTQSRGIVIAASFDKKLHYAARRISDVEVYEYRVGFHLQLCGS